MFDCKLLILLLLFSCNSLAFAQAENLQSSRQLKTAIRKNLKSKYLLYLPQDYGKRRAKFPLIMYLHGGSLRGDDIERVRSLGLPQILETKRDFPFVVLAPQCPAGEIWTDTDTLVAVLDEVTKNYSVDEERVYLTGHSMGARGALYLAYKHPERFAAVVPISGFSMIDAWAEKLKNTPIWMFHGAKDEIAPLADMQSFTDKVRNYNGDAKLTVFADRDHFILDTYENESVYKWLLGHRKKQKMK